MVIQYLHFEIFCFLTSKWFSLFSAGFIYFVEIQDFLSPSECLYLRALAENKGLKESKTYGHKTDQILLRDLNEDQKLNVNEVSSFFMLCKNMPAENVYVNSIKLYV